MVRYSDKAIEIINELHKDRIDYESEYTPLIDCANQCSDYEDTGLTPEQCAEYAKADREGRYIVLRDAERVKRLRELDKADKEGRVAVLPCKVGGSMLDMSDIEHPEIMKRLHFAVAYESVRGIIFYIPYDVFREYIDAGHVQPLSKDAEKALEATKDE